MQKKPQFSRRGLLTRVPLAGLGSAPVLGCGKLATHVPGELLGASLAVGHLLRGATLEQTSGDPERVGIAIVGGGPSGLSAAWRLERLGYSDFVVLELEPAAGGTASYGRNGRVPYPWGAHYVPVPGADNHGLVTLLDEMGMLERDAQGHLRGNERWLVREAEERVFVDGEWHEGLFPSALATAQDRQELARFEAEIARYVALRDARGRRAFALPMSLSSDDAELTALDRISAAKWLENGAFRSPLVRWYVEYACRDDYGASLERTSAWAMLFYFCARVPAPSEPSAQFLSWPEGNGRLVRHLAGVVGGRLRTEQLVTDIVPAEEHVDLSVLDGRTRELRRIRARAVILATPSFVTARVLRPFREARPAFFDELEFSPWWVANVHLRERPRSSGFPAAWDNVLFDSPSVGYVVATHQALLDRGPTIWTYYRPLWEDPPKLARQKLLALDQKTAAAALLDDLGRAHIGLRGAIERVDVWRWGHAMITPRQGFIFGSARRQAAAPLGRVHFAHSDLSGIPLFEEAQLRGVLAAEAALTQVAAREVPPLYGPGV